MILDRSRSALDRSCGVGLATVGKWLGKDEHGLATAILTRRNSVAISIAESSKMAERPLKTLRKSEDFQAEYKEATPSSRSGVFSTLTRAPDCIPTNRAASASGSRLFCFRSGEGQFNRRPCRLCSDPIRMAVIRQVRRPALNGLSEVLQASSEYSGVAFSNPCAR